MQAAGVVVVPVADKYFVDQAQIFVKSLCVVGKRESRTGIEKVGSIRGFDERTEAVFSNDAGLPGTVFTQDGQRRFHVCLR